MAIIEAQGTPDESAQAEEDAKIAAAKAELLDEQQQPSGFLGGKYSSVEEMEEGYKNLQREVERLRNDEVDTEAEVETAEEEPVAEQEEEQEEEEQQDGPSEADVTRIYDLVVKQAGGDKQLEAIRSWAADNQSDSAKEQWQEALNSANEEAILSILKSWQYDRMMQKGYEPKLTRGRAPTTEVRGFASEAQAVQAMMDPRYRENPDPAYIREVEQRMAASPNIFTQTRY